MINLTKRAIFHQKKWTELKNVMNQPGIVIKEAERGGTATVLSKNHYRAVIYEHLSKQNTYQKLDKNLDPAIRKKLKNY